MPTGPMPMGPQGGPGPRGPMMGSGSLGMGPMNNSLMPGMGVSAPQIPAKFVPRQECFVVAMRKGQPLSRPHNVLMGIVCLLFEFIYYTIVHAPT